MPRFVCYICNESYSCKRDLNTHVYICNEYYKFQNDGSSAEQMPNTKIVYRMLKDLLQRVEYLEIDNQKMRTQVLKQQRNDILFWLNENISSRHSVPDAVKNGFVEWYRKFNIGYKHLEKVFHETLNESIKQIISENIEKKTEIPICAFSQKHNTMYIYDKIEKKEETSAPATELNVTITKDKPSMVKGGKMTSWSWLVMKNSDLSLMIEFIQNSLLRQFIKWEDANMDIIELNEEMKELDIKYSVKINGDGISMERRTESIKKWLYEKLEVNHNVSTIDYS